MGVKKGQFSLWIEAVASGSEVSFCTELKPLAAAQGWPGLAAVLAIENIRGINGAGRVTAEIRCYLSSSQRPPEQLAAAIRRHWTIENGLHWVLDVGFHKDASRVRERTAARNLALLRKIALNWPAPTPR